MGPEEDVTQTDSRETEAPLVWRELANEILLIGYAVLVPVLALSDSEIPRVLHVTLGIGFVFFLPGYGLLSLLFPRHGGEEKETIGRAGLSWPRRVVLSFGASIAILPILGIVLAVTGLGVERPTVVIALAVTTVGLTLIAGARRLQIPEHERYNVPFGRTYDELRAAFPGGGPVNKWWNVLLVVLAISALVTLTYALVVPPEGEGYTQFYLLNETSDGELVASGYPEDLTDGESYELYVGIDNYERVRTTYSVVTELQYVQTSGGEITVVTRQPLDSFDVTLDPGETVREGRPIRPELNGEELRLIYYLYKGDPPEEPNTETAYRSIHVWVNVEPP
jgi:uncharacterized membrane protein